MTMEQFLMEDTPSIIGALLVLAALAIVLWYWGSSYLERTDAEWARKNPPEHQDLEKVLTMSGVSQRDRDDILRGTKT